MNLVIILYILLARYISGSKAGLHLGKKKATHDVESNKTEIIHKIN